MAKASKDPSAPKKKSRWLLYTGIAVGIIGLIVWTVMQPRYGSIQFGICKVFIEKTLSYPLDYRVVSVYEKPNEVRMEYTSTNEYGEYILRQVSCRFRPDPVTVWALTEVLQNRVKLPEEMVTPFNATIPGIIANPPDLALPYEPGDNLMNLQR
ncbi:MAG: hypothetical protein JWO78_603 [Micavibrio sp.]|nr:hypothetical protein [Micavibrio sp.]